MSKVKLLSVAATLTMGLMVSINALAETGDWYVSASLGYIDSSATVFNDGTNGAGNPEADLENDTVVSFAVGKFITDAFKVELAYSEVNFDTNAGLQSGSGIRALDQFGIDAQLDSQFVSLNASYLFLVDKKINPYLKAGLGVNSFEASGDLYVSSFGGNTFGGFLPATFTYSGDDTETGYFLGAGISTGLTDSLDLLIEYRYSDLGELATDFDSNGDRLKTDLETESLGITLEYSF